MPTPYQLNRPPDTFVRVPTGVLRSFVADVGQAVGLPVERAARLAEVLTANDVRGIHSHGTRLIAGYAQQMRDGLLNASPAPRVLRETPVSLVIDGDGGLGYFPMLEGTELAIQKAREHGVAVMQSRNHGHIGAAGIYTRMPLEHDLLAFVTGGNRLALEPGMPVYTPAIGSPMSFGAPAGDRDPLVLDFSPVYDLRISPHWSEIARWVPGTVFRCIGLGMVAQVWGGILAGIPLDSSRTRRRFAEATQTALLVTFQIGLFVDPTKFRREMDELAQRVESLSPLEGFERAQLPGGPEAEREREYLAEGVPVGPEHREDLESVGREFGVKPPW